MSTELISGSAPASARPRQYGRRQQNPVRRFGGIAVVLLLHIVLIYALTNGLATKVVQVIQHPIETKIIEPVKPPPPPPFPTVKLPPPKFAPPPPPDHSCRRRKCRSRRRPQPTITHQATPVGRRLPYAPPAPPAPPAPTKPVSPNRRRMPELGSDPSSMGYPKEARTTT